MLKIIKIISGLFSVIGGLSIINNTRLWVEVSNVIAAKVTEYESVQFTLVKIGYFLHTLIELYRQSFHPLILAITSWFPLDLSILTLDVIAIFVLFIMYRIKSVVFYMHKLINSSNNMDDLIRSILMKNKVDGAVCRRGTEYDELIESINVVEDVCSVRRRRSRFLSMSYASLNDSVDKWKASDYSLDDYYRISGLAVVLDEKTFFAKKILGDSYNSIVNVVVPILDSFDIDSHKRHLEYKSDLKIWAVFSGFLLIVLAFDFAIYK